MDKTKLLTILASQAPNLLKSLTYGNFNWMEPLKQDLSNAREVPGMDEFINRGYDLGLMEDTITQSMKDDPWMSPDLHAMNLGASEPWTTDEMLAYDVPEDIEDPLMLQILKKYRN